MNLSGNLSGLTLTLKKQEVEPEVSKEEYEFSVEATDLPVLEQASSGALVSIEQLDGTGIDPIISQEEMASPVIMEHESTILAGPDTPAPKLPATIFAMNEKHVRAYLYGRCSETVDTLVHILACACDDIKIDIYICSPDVTSCETIELVGAIAGSAADVSISLQDTSEVSSLLFLTLGKHDTVSAGYVVHPTRNHVWTNVTNAEINIAAFASYEKIIYDALLETNVLSKEEVVSLRDNRNIVFIEGSDITDRMK